MSSARLKARFAFAKFEPRDLWVGVFWDRLPDGWIAVYVCLLPAMVFRFDVTRAKEDTQ